MLRGLADAFSLFFRGGVKLRSGGRTLDFRDLDSGGDSPIPEGTYWIKRGSATTTPDGQDVVPLFTTEDAARRWPGDGDVVQASGPMLGTALEAAGGAGAAAIDPASLEVLRRGPDAADTARWIRLA
jgi:hypothetical protein